VKHVLMILLLLLPVVVVAKDEFIFNKDFRSWSKEECRRVLEKSKAKSPLMIATAIWLTPNTHRAAYQLIQIDTRASKDDKGAIASIEEKRDYYEINLSMFNSGGLAGLRANEESMAKMLKDPKEVFLQDKKDKKRFVRVMKVQHIESDVSLLLSKGSLVFRFKKTDDTGAHLVTSTDQELEFVMPFALGPLRIPFKIKELPVRSIEEL